MHMQNHIKYDLANPLTELAGNLFPQLDLSTTVGSKVHTSCQINEQEYLQGRGCAKLRRGTALLPNCGLDNFCCKISDAMTTN